MGWARTLLLGDIGNRLDIEDVEREVRALERDLENLAADQVHDLEALRAENESLKLYVAALTRLLLAKNVIGEDELTLLVNAIDREDGKADGRLDGPVLDH